MIIPKMKNFQIEKYIDDGEIIRKTIHQIKKDLSFFGLNFIIAIDDLNVNHIKNQLAVIVKDLLVKDSEKLFSLLYRIDIPEEKLKNIPAEISYEKFISQLILERELLKVIIRKNI